MNTRIVITAATITASLSAPLWAGDGGRLQADAINYRAQGIELQQRGDTNGAMAMLQKAIQLDPNYPTPHNDLGILYESIGRLDDAEREYQAALVLNPSYAKAHTNLALLYERQGKKDLAAAHWFQRYTLGAASDPWTRTAKERLVALGYLQPDAAAPAKPSAGSVEKMPAQSTHSPAPTTATPSAPAAAPPAASPPAPTPVATAPAVPASTAHAPSAAMPSAPPAPPPPVTLPVSSQQRALQAEMSSHQIILREFDAVTTADPESRKIWKQRPYTTTTGTQSR